MSQSVFAGLLLLVSAHVTSFDHYHVRSPIYACVDPQAALALNPGGRTRRHRVVHREDRCFRVRPGEKWEQIAHPARSLLLLRRQPPHPGEPPLYFKTSTVVLSRPVHQHGHRLHHALVSRERVGTGAGTAAAIVPAGQAAMPTAPSPAPSATVPLPPTASQPAASSPVPASAAASPPHRAASRPAAPPVVNRAAVPATRPVVRPSGFVHRFSPLLVWLLVIALATLLVRRVRRRRPAALDDVDAASPGATSRGWSRFRFASRKLLRGRPAAATEPTQVDQPPAVADAIASDDAMSAGEYKSRCVARLRDAGWDARTRFSADARGPHVIASHGGLVIALQCHPSTKPVDVEAVKDACLVRERQCSDLAAVVSNAPFTEPARQLAARTGIVLLHEDQLASLTV